MTFDIYDPKLADNARDVIRALQEALANGAKLTRAEADCVAERRRQMESEGFHPAHDDHHENGELVMAALCYAMNAVNDRRTLSRPPPSWPWGAEWWKPKTARRDLVRAVALLIAEIERMDRKPTT